MFEYQSSLYHAEKRKYVGSILSEYENVFFRGGTLAQGSKGYVPVSRDRAST
jgi:hypothetical protein